MRAIPAVKQLIIITGHYGSGKTNLAINLALDLSKSGLPVTLVDLDIVNPYFRSSDYTGLLERYGVRVIGPTFAGTTLDAPSLPAAISGAIESEGFVLFDVGGDDAGATALGRYAAEIAARGYDMLYVINYYRNLTATPQEAADVLAAIEAASHLLATGVVNNSNLRTETTAATILDSMPFAQRTAELLGLPLTFTTVPLAVADEFSTVLDTRTCARNVYPVELYVRLPWEESPTKDGKA